MSAHHTGPCLATIQKHCLERSRFDLLHPDDRDTLIPQWRQLLSDGSVQSICRIRHANGEWRWIESFGQCLRAPGPACVRARVA